MENRFLDVLTETSITKLTPAEFIKFESGEKSVSSAIEKSLSTNYR